MTGVAQREKIPLSKMSFGQSLLRPATAGALVALALIPVIAEAQVSPRRWQATLLVSSIRFADPDPVIEQLQQDLGRDIPLATWWEPGVGVRLGFRLTHRFSVELEASLFPRYADLRDVELDGRGQVSSGGAKGQIVAGLVVRHTLSGVVILGRVRPGAVSFTGFSSIVVRSQGGLPTVYATVTAPATFPALDIGVASRSNCLPVSSLGSTLAIALSGFGQRQVN